MGGTRGSPIMPRDAVSRTANVERNGGHKWVNKNHRGSLIDMEICVNIVSSVLVLSLATPTKTTIPPPP